MDGTAPFDVIKSSLRGRRSLTRQSHNTERLLHPLRVRNDIPSLRCLKYNYDYIKIGCEQFHGWNCAVRSEALLCKVRACISNFHGWKFGIIKRRHAPCVAKTCLHGASGLSNFHGWKLRSLIRSFQPEVRSVPVCVRMWGKRRELQNLRVCVRTQGISI